MNLFGQHDTKEARDEASKTQIRQWTRKLKGEVRGMEREIQKIEREEDKVKKEVKSAAKQGNMKGAEILAKELVRSRHAKDRLYQSRAQLSSVQMELTNQVATMKLTDCMKMSTDVMKHMNSLIKMPEMKKTMLELQKEMMKAGVIDEMMEDTMEMMDEGDTEEATQDEINKILADLAIDAVAKAPETLAPKATPMEPEVEVEEKQLFERLKAL